jgi:hypothetical protein
VTLLLRGWDPKVPRGLPVSFTSALIQRRASCPPLPLVESIQNSKHHKPSINHKKGMETMHKHDCVQIEHIEGLRDDI